MFNQHRIFRVFQLLSSLRSQPPKDTGYLCQLLGTSERTIYRYLDLLKKTGFDVRVDSEGRYSLMVSDLALHLMLSDEEVTYLSKILAQSPSGDNIADAIQNKLGLFSNIGTVAEWLHQSRISRILQVTSVSIVEKRQVILKSYHSAGNGTIHNRLVEPITFADQYQTICAYEPSTKTNKYFCLEHMEDVKLLNESQCNEQAHEFSRTDVFGFAITNTPKQFHARMELPPLRYLLQHFPMTRAFLKVPEEQGCYELKVPVGHFHTPASLFRLFPGQIHALSDSGFRRYLKRDQEKWNDI